ncbi:hypothetical protein LTR84_005736 [Exophiala bonariae]|uniref:Major facilitator superfamily (MFS) profile domain-containing protein n=1 Tax=Exophiala bonariae TaxID=1690606 RepID=A0AAV9N3E2_9EURO|nr:hypothetical protein LTR84_005736 [Exophiala bonariae]
MGQNDSALEKRLIRKLDFFIVAYCCLCYFLNYLDRNALANAYVAGMKESLNLKQNDYSSLLSIFTAGLLTGNIPHALILQKVQPRIWIPTTVLVWSGLTMACAGCHNFAQIATVRFLQGWFEGSLYCGAIFIVGSCKADEISVRTSIFTSVGQVGSMFAGIMMTAMRTSMDGHRGMEGWRWVFIVDGLMGVPVGIFGLLFLPNTPKSTKMPYLSKEEIELAISRMPPVARDSKKINPRSLAKRVLKTPNIYILTAFSIFSAMTEGCFLLWMRHYQDKYSKAAVNTYPLGIQAVAIVSMIVAGAYVDRTKNYVVVGIVSGLLQMLSGAMLVVPSLPDAGTFFAMYLSGTSFVVNPLLYGWGGVITRRNGDEAARAVTLYTMSTGGLLLYTFWGIVLYPASDAPYWKKGAITLMVAVLGFWTILYWVNWLDKRTQKLLEDKEAEVDVVVSETQVIETKVA